jgi:hypothetical protein
LGNGCQSQKKKTEVTVDHLDLSRHFRNKNSSMLFFLSQVSIDLHKNLLRYRKFMLGGHLEFVLNLVSFALIYF